MRDWPRLQRAMINHFNNTPALGRAASRTPGNLHQHPVFTRITAPSVLDDGREQTVVLDFDVFAPVFDDAEDHAHLVRRAVLGMHNRIIAGAQIDTVTSVDGPVERDWHNNPNPADTAVTRFLYSARVVLRRQPTT